MCMTGRVGGLDSPVGASARPRLERPPKKKPELKQSEQQPGVLVVGEGMAAVGSPQKATTKRRRARKGAFNRKRPNMKEIAKRHRARAIAVTSPVRLWCLCLFRAQCCGL